MAQNTLNDVLTHLRRLCEVESSRELGDRELLERFLSRREEGAFTILVQRHGPMVLGVCQRVLKDRHAAEDAFQATFLVLIRKSASIRKSDSLGSWLYGVARRIALRARARDTATRSRVRRSGEMVRGDTLDELTWQELRTVLDEEIASLPERYRAPVVLCHLEGKSYDQAARELGWPKSSLASRLTRARDVLRQRLARRGIALSAAALAAGLTEKAASAALPALLTINTVKGATLFAAGKTAAGALSSQVIALAEESMRGILGFKGKVLVLLLTAGLTAGGVGLAGHQLPGEKPSQAQRRDVCGPVVAAQKLARPDPEKATDPAMATVTCAGRVLGPDGKPIAEAKLFAPRLKRNPPTSNDDIGVEQVGTSAADGRFQVTIQNAFRQYRAYLFAHADGFGVEWVELPDEKSGADDVVLQLVNDQPIAGRILDTEGKPVGGATVSIASVTVPDDAKLDDYLTGWKKSWQDTAASPKKRLFLPLDAITGAATTDKNGQYKLTGGGVERVLQISIQGRGFTRTTPWVVTRAGFDPKPYNEAALAQGLPEVRIKGQTPILYGPEATIVIEAGKVVEGVVKDLATGKPLAGIRVSALFGSEGGSNGVTDADGKYRLDGLPPDKSYQVYATPRDGSSYLSRSGTAQTTPGTAPVRIDIELAKGVVVSGRVIDRETGKGVVAGIRFAPLPDNKHFGKPGFDGYRSDRTVRETDEEGGAFRLATIPGKSLMMLQTHGREKIDGEYMCPYLTARPDPDYKDLFTYEKDSDTWRFHSAENFVQYLGTENVVKVVDLKEDGPEVKVELFVERGKTAKIIVQDTDGKPLPGVFVAGRTAHWPITYRLKTTDPPATVYALDPDRPRRLVLLHPEKKLGGTVTLRGTEKDPVVVKLAPLGAVSGRFQEVDGAPLAGADVSLNFPDEITRELYRFAERTTAAVKTDKDGRFILPGIVPGVKFGIQTQKGKTYYQGEPRIGLREVEPGKTLDLGEWKLKPGN